MSDEDAYAGAFYMTDLNGDGHITASEWALFYTTSDLKGLPKYSYGTWIRAFENQINEPGFDKNHNGQMEFNGKFE